MTVMPLQKILIAIRPRGDGSEATLEHVRFFARRTDCELRLASCVFDTVVSAGISSGESHSVTAEAAMIGSQKRDLLDLVENLGNIEREIETSARWGEPAEDVILDEAADWGAHLLVVGAGNENLQSGLGIRGFGTRIAPRSTCPVLLAKRRTIPDYRRILAAIDPLHGHDEPYGLDAVVLAAARGFADKFGAELDAIHAYPDPESFELASSIEVEPGVHFGTENLPGAHRGAAVELAASFGVDEGRVHLIAGDATSAISSTARERGADLIAIGAVKRGRLAEAILGSTARRVAAEVDCDILLVAGPLSEQTEM